MDKKELVAFGAWQASNRAIANAQRLSAEEIAQALMMENAALKATVTELVTLVEYLQRG